MGRTTTSGSVGKDGVEWRQPAPASSTSRGRSERARTIDCPVARALAAAADLLDLLVAIVGDVLAVAAVLLLELLEGGGVARLGEVRAVHDLALGEARFRDPPGFRDRRPLLVRQR